MRMMPSGMLALRNPRGTPLRAKGKAAAQVAHFSAPLKGLSRLAELSEADPMLASVLTNWIVEDDRISLRPGYVKIGQISGNPAVSTLVPYYGGTGEKLAAAAGGKLYNTAGTEIAAGPYGSNDWAWTSYSDLGATDYTVMVNGVNGVVSWDGLTTFATETVTVPTGETWIDPLKFDKVISHMNRLWFADSENLAVYYLPIQQKSGTLELLPLDAIFTRGGNIVGMCTWSIDGGKGLDDAIVIFTSHGEVAIYSGVDPESDFKLVGIFRFDSPMSKNSIMNFGGDIYVMVASGFLPLTTLIRSETEQLGKSDMNVIEEFQLVSRVHRADFGWQVMLNSQTGHAICNMPLGGGKYQQMVRKMPGQIWSKWLDVPSRCWAWLDNRAYFATDTGGIYIGGREHLSDDGAPINTDVRFAWSSYRNAMKKNFKMMRLYVITDGQIRPYMDMEVDYNNLPPTNLPEATFGPAGGSAWDTSSWDTSDWTTVAGPQQMWQGVTGLGRVGAARIRTSTAGTTLAITGVDVIYEMGGLI